MELQIETKWEWIARQCKDSGYNAAAEIALAIEEVLLKIYGNKNTSEWLCDYADQYSKMDKANIDVLWEVTNTTCYCIACAKQPFICGCKGCPFASAVGKCNSGDSMFAKFGDELDKAEEEEGGE